MAICCFGGTWLSLDPAACPSRGLRRPPPVALEVQRSMRTQARRGGAGGRCSACPALSGQASLLDVNKAQTVPSEDGGLPGCMCSDARGTRQRWSMAARAASAPAVAVAPKWMPSLPVNHTRRDLRSQLQLDLVSFNSALLGLSKAARWLQAVLLEATLAAGHALAPLGHPASRRWSSSRSWPVLPCSRTLCRAWSLRTQPCSPVRPSLGAVRCSGRHHRCFENRREMAGIVAAPAPAHAERSGAAMSGGADLRRALGLGPA